MGNPVAAQMGREEQAAEPEAPSTEVEQEEDDLPPFPEPLSNYPKPPDPQNRSAEFENVLAYMYQARKASINGELPPACGFGRYIGVNPQGEPQRYQSKLDERWDHFTTWLHNKWTAGIDKLPNWAQT